MFTEKEDDLQGTADDNKINLPPDAQNNTAANNSEEIIEFYNDQILSAEHTDDEITNNDGSVKETLDTTFHDTPGYKSDHSVAGSNRADFYEKRSQGKSDSEEEQDYMRNHQQE
jgi:hypothetical protein